MAYGSRFAVIALCLAAIVTSASVPAHAGVLDDLDAISRLPYSARATATTYLLERHPANPIHDTDADGVATAVLLYRGAGRELRIAGDWTAWEAADMWHHVRGTDLWYLGRRIDGNARLDYKIVRDGVWVLDPRNPLTCMSGFGPNSELRGAHYTAPDWLTAAAARPCRLDTLEMTSPELGNTRTVVVIVPPDVAQRPKPFLLVHDGLEYISLAHLDRYLAVAAARADLRVPICVCVPPVNRTQEYAGSQQADFGRFVVETLIPEIEGRYAGMAEAGEPWGSIGASYGGRVTLDLARRYPGRFDRLAPMSPSVAYAQHAGVAAVDPALLRLYVNWGRFDIPRLIPECERFAEMIAERGFAHRIEVLPQGHSWGLWRDTLDDAFTFLYAD